MQLREQRAGCDGMTCIASICRLWDRGKSLGLRDWVTRLSIVRGGMAGRASDSLLACEAAL